LLRTKFLMFRRRRVSLMHSADFKRWGDVTGQLCYHDTKYVTCANGVSVDWSLAVTSRMKRLDFTCFQLDASHNLARCT
jgi:hypothetical protein